MIESVAIEEGCVKMEWSHWLGGEGLSKVESIFAREWSDWTGVTCCRGGG